MKLGVFIPTQLPHSGLNYVNNVSNELEASGVKVSRFSENEKLPEQADLYWDPCCFDGGPPYKELQSTEKPFVVTVHGTASFTLPIEELLPHLQDINERDKIRRGNLEKLDEWHSLHKRWSAIITVSEYAKTEIKKHLHLNEGIIPIYHGVDHALFKPDTTHHEQEPYLLHISSYQPLKNMDRIISAYKQLPMEDKPRLIAVVPGYSDIEPMKGIEIIRTKVNHERLATFYQNATGFLFPSLRESFGMPIIEAMACGCPVITSNISACAEVAGDAALLVNPRSVEEITSGMKRLITDSKLRRTLREKGIKRAGMFSWRKSAEEHLKVFEEALMARFLRRIKPKSYVII